MDSQNDTDFELPQAPQARLRKLARLGVLGAGYLLMAQGQFRSFKGIEVLPPLEEDLPEWAPFLRETERFYIAPPDVLAKENVEYQSHLLLWLEQVNQPLANG